MFDREPVIAIVACGEAGECWAQLGTFIAAARDPEARQGMGLLFISGRSPEPASELARGTAIVRSVGELASTGGIARLPVAPDLERNAGSLNGFDPSAVDMLLALQQAFELAQVDEIDGLLLLESHGRSSIASAMPDALMACLAEIAATVGGIPSDMMGRVFAAPGLWHHCLMPATPTAEVERLLDARLMTAGFQRLTGIMRRAGLQRPKIGLCSLKPESAHAGGIDDVGLEPTAFERARNAGIEIFGPWPTARIYQEASLGGFDGIVSLHDEQAEILDASLDMAGAVELITGAPVPIARPRSRDDDGNPRGSDEMFAALRMLGVLARGCKPVFRFRGEGRLGNPPPRPTGPLPRTSTGLRRRSG